MQYQLTRAGRLQAIRDFLTSSRVSSQQDLVKRLEELGFSVTQATVSRDLVELRAARTRDSSGEFVYVISDVVPSGNGGIDSSRLLRIIADMVVSTAHVANQVVVRTHAGAAQFLAAAIDDAGDERILGTIAGDDTVLIICWGSAQAEEFSNLMRITLDK
ncbi:arginine repressor [Actinomycetaceae bacterium TAE3-ERU4]|nr:arginine repressor [Actinomycetaceae bacterium TAE3-ERU4]